MAAAAAAAVAAERAVYRTTNAFPLAHAMDLHTYASANRVNETRTQQKQEQHNDDYCQQRQQTGPTAVAAARSNGGQLRTIEPPIVRLMTPCLGGCALTYASARGLHTQKKTEVSTHCTQQNKQQQNSTAIVFRSSNSSKQAQQQ